MSLTCKVQITLGNLTEGKMAAVRRALEPDNVDFPDGLSLDIKESGGGLVLHLESRHGTKSLVSTLDEVLEHVQVSLSVME